MPDANTATAEAPTPATQAPLPPPAPDIGPVAKTNPELQSIFGKLRSKAGMEPVAPAKKEAPKPPKPTAKTEPKADDPTSGGDGEEGTDPGTRSRDTDKGKSTDEPGTDEAKDDGETAKGADAKVEGDKAPAEGTEKGKTGPWKLVRQYEKRTRELEGEVAELRKGGTSNPQQVQELKERLQAVEAKNKEYVDALRFHDYEKHDPEFQTKYDKPYRDAFHRAVAEISELNVTQPDGELRPATAQDMLDLVQLPLAKAKPLAKALFGEDFAEDAMRHRSAIKDVFDARQRALDEARTGLDAREKQRAQERETQTSEVTKFVSESWEKANRDAVTDERYGQFFAPRESDPEWNQRLAKGFELVDRAFNSANPMDPTLTKEQRREIINRHAAVRHRAAAWGPLRHDNERKAARIAELEAKLAEYKESEPKLGTSEKTPPKDAGPQDPMERMLQGIRKYAK